METISPHATLEPFVECYWAWAIPADSGELDPILPDAAPELIFHLATPPKALRSSGRWEPQCESFLLCASQRAVRLVVESPMAVFAIRFRPWGASRFTEASMASLLDREVPIADVFTSFGADLHDRIRKASDTAECVAAADAALCTALSADSTRDETIRKLHRLAAGGLLKGRDIAAALGVSERTFRRQWHDIVGLEQRKFVSLMRFHRALELLDAGEELAVVASESGYADQPHLARDFKSISGLPASLLRKRLGADVYRALYTNRPAAPWKGE